MSKKTKTQDENERFELKTTIIMEHRDSYNRTSEKITLETYGVTISDLLRSFEQALRGAGFQFKGVLEIIDEEQI